jgi:hypothetical protein
LVGAASLAPSGDQWLHEIKHDGIRLIAPKEDKRIKLYSRPGNDLTHRFPLMVEALARLRSRSCILDGEAVACDLILPYYVHDPNTSLPPDLRRYDPEVNQTVVRSIGKFDITTLVNYLPKSLLVVRGRKDFITRDVATRGGTSRMTRECQVRFCERLGVKFPGPTRQTRSFGDIGSMSRLPESEHGWAIYEYTPFCNGPCPYRKPKAAD